MNILRKVSVKFWVCSFLLLCSLLFPAAAHAATKKSVVITVDGKTVDFDVKPYIDEQNRTIVPIRFIGEKLNYFFNWDGSKKEVTVTGNGSTIKIWIGVKEALVDGKKATMDTVAVLDQGRAMVPLRFIVENMGASISYDPTTKVVNVFKSLNTGSNQLVRINSPLVNIRSGPGTTYEIVTQAKLGDTFLVIGEKDGWNQIALNDGRKAWVIARAVDPVELNQQEPADKPEPEPSKPVEVIKDKVAVISASVVNIRSGPGTNYPTLSKANFGTAFEVTGRQGDWYQVAVNDQTGWVAGWLVSLRDNTGSSSRSEEPGERREEPIPTPKLNTILDFQVDTEREEIIFTIEGESKLSYSNFRLNNPSRIVLDFPFSVLDDPNSVETFDLEHDLVKSIRVAQFQPDQVRVVFDLTGTAGLTLLKEKAGGRVLQFQLGKPSIKGKTIVIDPGHGQIKSGGYSDPGAIGPNNLYERDVNLDIAIKTAAILRDKGANVILTRTGDTDLTLAGRATVANDNNADIFVSIHCNAHTNRSVQGTSTYYYSNVSGQAEARKRLASAVQTELVKAIGRKNLGILQANFAVLRYTAMPSILVETAFISNPEEEQLLATPSFRAKVAEGIAKGIEVYFSE